MLNTVHLTNDLNNICIDKNTRMCSFDIKNMYTNIPTKQVIEIITQVLNNQDVHPKQEIINMTRTVVDQNFFTFNDEYYK
jgi:hypothetical protein